jgi:hypothetical protein
MSIYKSSFVEVSGRLGSRVSFIAPYLGFIKTAEQVPAWVIEKLKGMTAKNWKQIKAELLL